MDGTGEAARGDRAQRAAWHALETTAVFQQLKTSAEFGLTNEEAARRLVRYGPNELAEEPRPGFWRMLLAQFNNFIVIILIAAASVSILLGDLLEGGAILAIVILNAVLGVVQERRAEEALAALRRLAAPDARALRGGSRDRKSTRPNSHHTWIA